MKKAVILLALAPLMTMADKVYLKSGSYLTGTAGVIQGNVLKFASDDLGDVDIKIENITKLESLRKHVVQHNDNSKEEIALSVSNGVYIVDNRPFDMSDVKATDPAEETWHGSINAAFLAKRGNTYENSWSVFGDINRRWEKDRFNALFGYYYSETGTGSDDQQKTTDRWEAEAQHDHFWADAIYHYENLRYDRDMIQSLLARYRLGIGLGYQWLDGYNQENTGKWSFNQEVGINWVKEDYEDADDDKKDGYAAFRYAHHLKYLPKWNDGVECFHNLEFLPDVEDWDKYLVKADIGFSAKLVYDFLLTGKIEWDFNSVPANDRKKSDVRYILGLGYSW